MTVQEAVRLVIQAGAIGSDGRGAGARHGRAGAHRRRRPAARRRGRAARSRSSTPACARARSCTRCCSAPGEPDHRPNHPLISQVPVPPLDGAVLSLLDPTAPRDGPDRRPALARREPGAVRRTGETTAGRGPDRRARAAGTSAQARIHLTARDGIREPPRRGGEHAHAGRHRRSGIRRAAAGRPRRRGRPLGRRLRRRRGADQAARRRRVLRRGRVVGRAAGGPRQRRLPPVVGPALVRRLRRRGHHRARPRCATARPTCPTSRQSARTLARYLRPGATVVARVDHLPGHHRGAGRADPRGGLRPDRRRRLPPRLQPGAHRPGQPRPGTSSTRRRSSPGIDAASLERGPGVLRHGRRARPCRSPTARRPSWPSCSRTRSGTSTSRWSTSWRCSRTTSASTSGRRSTRRRPSRSASCGSRPGPGVGGHCLPIDPSYLSWRVQRTLGQSFRFVELANDINDHMPDYVVRRLVAALNQRRKAVNGSTRPAARPGVQEEHRRRPRVAGAPGRRAAAGHGRRGARRRPARGRGRRTSTAACVRVELTAEEIAAADAVVLLADHDAFDFDLVVQHARYVLDTRHRLTGPTVESL